MIVTMLKCTVKLFVLEFLASTLKQCLTVRNLIHVDAISYCRIKRNKYGVRKDTSELFYNINELNAIILTWHRINYEKLVHAFVWFTQSNTCNTEGKREIEFSVYCMCVYSCEINKEHLILLYGVSCV